MISWTIFGENRFNDANAYLLPWIGLGLAIALTYVATTGVKRFSKISDLGGKLTLAVTVIFIVFAVVGVLIGKQPSATIFTPATVIPKFDADYFSTFSWLILAVAGAEVAGTYIKDAGYVVYKILAENWGLNGKIFVQIYAFILTISSIAAFVVWLESTIRAMFSEVPTGTFPKFLTNVVFILGILAFFGAGWAEIAGAKSNINEN